MAPSRGPGVGVKFYFTSTQSRVLYIKVHREFEKKESGVAEDKRNTVLVTHCSRFIHNSRYLLEEQLLETVTFEHEFDVNVSL